MTQFGPYTAHPIADKFDMLEESALASLADSIGREGQAIPCVVWGDYLVDGRNRWRACERAGVTPKIERRQFANEAECGRWIIAVNKDRRHLTISQLAWICTEPDVISLYREEARERQEASRAKPGERADERASAPANLRERHEREAVAQAAAAFGVSARSAQSAQAVRARGTDELALAVREKRMAVSVAAEVSKLPAEKQREVVERAAVKSNNETPEVRGGLVRQLVKQEIKQETARRIEAEPAPMPAGPFRVIVSDPPWAYEKRAGDATHRIDLPYPSMTTPEIAALDVQSLAHPDGCILWLWTTNAFMRDAYKLLDAWGFQEKTILTWVKDRMGMGDWLRGQTEHCILAVRGKPTVVLTNQTTALHGPMREHSRKPDEFYALVESICPGSKVEMFCRTPRAGWAKWGAETEKFDAVG